MAKKLYFALATLLFACLYSTLSSAQAPCQWNYSFDANGNAVATYCGNVKSANVNKNPITSQLTKLTANSAIVPVAPYTTLYPVASGTANFGPSSGETSLNFIDVCHVCRIRENGNITQIKVYTASLTGVTGFYFQTWRQTGQNGSTPLFSLVGQSANLASNLTAASVNTVALANPIAALPGDYVGAYVTYSSASAQNFVASAIPNTTTGQDGGIIYSLTNAAATAINYNWTAQTATTNKAVLIEADMQAPVSVEIGDSITAGARSSDSFVSNYTTVINPVIGYPYAFNTTFNYSYQNMGISGNTTAQMLTRFSTDVVALSPKFVVINGGINDFLGGATSTQVLTNVQGMLDKAVAAGMIPVVIGTTPFSTNVSATGAMMAQRDAYNAAVASLVTSYPYNGYYVSPDSLGVFDSTGTNGNLWKLNPVYDGGDGTHPTPYGYTIEANAVEAALSGLNTLSLPPMILSPGIGASFSTTGTPPTAPLTVGCATTNLSGNIYELGYCDTKTDTALQRGGTLLQSNDNNPFVLYLSAVGGASQAVRTAVFQTAEDGVANDGIISFQPNGGFVRLNGPTTMVSTNASVNIDYSLSGTNYFNATEEVFRSASGTRFGNIDAAGFTLTQGVLNLSQAYSAAGTALPTCNSSSKGSHATVSDATAPTYLGAYISGGTVIAPVFCNGTSWLTD